MMSADICGLFNKGTDLGVSKRRKVKYALIATIPVPQSGRLQGSSRKLTLRLREMEMKRKKIFYQSWNMDLL